MLISCFELNLSGKTGSGKTYTMWGPPSALSEDSSSSEWGLTPRVFERLFSRINEVGSLCSPAQHGSLDPLMLTGLYLS